MLSGCISENNGSYLHSVPFFRNWLMPAMQPVFITARNRGSWDPTILNLALWEEKLMKETKNTTERFDSFCCGIPFT